MSGKITIFFIILVHPLSSTSLPYDVLLSLEKNETLASPGDVFELGFFKPAIISNWYLGIWLKQDPNRTALWVANRNRPLLGSQGTLIVSNSNLFLLDRDNNHVWSTNIKVTLRPQVVVKLLENGNLVVKENTTETNRFDFPGDCLIPQMKLRAGTGKYTSILD
ncbi:S-locus-specific glycoprotein S13-like [Raphanus sativus]|uniref:S-locus-specific glycoprotein S13-like n=1 Tax=Raphanus sativus TaxID=3726 RepID=A0A6J0LHF5_RAPSA|nr:S-locus-specific glycoprotein S13-like [Raphanus sativus]